MLLDPHLRINSAAAATYVERERCDWILERLRLSLIPKPWCDERNDSQLQPG
jgi:hypothetical protein